MKATHGNGFASRRLHAALKAGGKSSSRGLRALMILTALVLVAGLGFGIYRTVCALNAVWMRQCSVPDVKSGIEISSTPHISSEIVREWFSLTNGCNLAEIDFSAARTKVLREHPIVKDISITLQLPNHAEIAVEERKPIARINPRRFTIRVRGREQERVAWDVVDREGIVFEFSPEDSSMLPLIREQAPSARRGEHLCGRALTALRLVELCTVRNVTTIAMPEISTANNTYLKITTQNYSTLNIPWRIIDNPADPDQPVLTQILKNFQDLMNQNLFPDNRSFYVPEPSRITVAQDQ